MITLIKNKINSYFGKKLLKKIILISKKYDLSKIELPKEYKNIYQYLHENPTYRSKYEPIKNDIYFIEKYNKYIENGHYGFSIGSPISPNWVEFLDEVLELCIKTDPNFKINQIKLKYGRICFYCSSKIIRDINEIETYLYELLSDDNLIY